MALSISPTRYIFGTTRLGDESIPFANRVGLARTVIESGQWLHTSDQYGSALSVLKAAILEAQRPVEGTIFKIGWDSVDQIRAQIEKQLEATGLTQMSLGQLCLGKTLAEDFCESGEMIESLLALKTEGLLKDFVLESWPWNSKMGLSGLQNGNAERLLGGYIFYCNPMQRFVTNALWDELVKRDFPFIAMRTLAGGSVYRARDVDGAAPEYLQSRAVLMAPIFEESSCDTWTEFCTRFALGLNNCAATVGATSNLESLDLYLHSVQSAVPLEPKMMDDILALHRMWSDEHDVHAKEWSM